MVQASQALLTLKAEVNCKDRFGDTALMRACEVLCALGLQYELRGFHLLGWQHTHFSTYDQID